jgi:hypothetical protein
MRIAKTTLALALGLFIALPGVAMADTTAVDSRELDAALAASVRQEDQARESVRTLLARDDVQKLAESAGLDLRRADAAVATLDGEELQEVARLAAQVNDELAGGAQTITISLVAALLIVIIIILLVD